MSRSQAVAIPLSAARSLLTDVEGARAALNAEIRTHIMAIADLKERLNTLTPIGRFSPEVLGEIFVQYAAANRDIDPKEWDGEYKWRRNNVLPLCLVSRYWYNTAVGTPRLWGQMYRLSNTRTVRWLWRSKTTPLFYYNPNYNETKRNEALVELGKNFHRMRDFNLRADRSALQTLCVGMGLSAPLLSDLCIEPTWSTRSTTEDSAIVFPARVTTPEQSRLRKVDLQDVLMKWDNTLLASSMSQLSLRGSIKAATALGTFAEFLEALRRMPGLKSLRLENVVPPPPSVMPQSQLISLPHLREISVVSETDNIAQFFAQLSTPAKLATLTVTLNSVGETDSLGVLGRSLARMVTAQLPLPYMRVGWPRHNSPSMCIRALRSATKPKDDEVVPFRLEMPNGDGAGTIFAPLAAACETETLLAEACRWYPWGAILSSCPTVTTLITHRLHAPSFRLGLTRVRDASVLPALEELELVEFAFSDRKRQTRSYKRLLEWLQARNKCGSPIARLQIGDARNMDGKVADRLRKMVDEVEVYGQQVVDHKCWSDGESD